MKIKSSMYGQQEAGEEKMGYRTGNMEMEFGGIIFQITVVKEKRKTVTLKILSDKELLLKAPSSFRDTYLKELIKKKEKWILEHTAMLAGEEGNFMSVRYIDGSNVYYMGKEYNICVRYEEREGKKAVKTQILIKDENIMVETSDTSEENVKNQMVVWYKNQARDKITDMVWKYQPFVKKSIGTIRIKSQKSRWGSCSELGNLNFNWHLILLPESLIEYVVVHELCHLKYLNHSSDFWNCVKNILPDYEEREKELKKYGRLLSID